MSDELTNYCGATNRHGEPCRQPAGAFTDHPGEGRCKWHGGKSLNGRQHPGFRNGRQAHRYRARMAVELRRKADQASEGDPVDMRGELYILRGLLADFVEGLPWWGAGRVGGGPGGDGEAEKVNGVELSSPGDRGGTTLVDGLEDSFAPGRSGKSSPDEGVYEGPPETEAETLARWEKRDRELLEESGDRGNWHERQEKTSEKSDRRLGVDGFVQGRMGPVSLGMSWRQVVEWFDREEHRKDLNTVRLFVRDIGKVVEQIDSYEKAQAMTMEQLEYVATMWKEVAEAKFWDVLRMAKKGELKKRGDLESVLDDYYDELKGIIIGELVEREAV